MVEQIIVHPILIEIIKKKQPLCYLRLKQSTLKTKLYDDYYFEVNHLSVRCNFCNCHNNDWFINI